MSASDVRRVNEPVEVVDYLVSVIPPNRVDYLRQTCLRALRRHPGHVLEVGVYRGGTFAVLAEAVRDEARGYAAIGIDTFCGHPETDGHPVHPVGKYSNVDLDVLWRCLDRRGLDRSVVRLEAGRVEDVLSRIEGPFAFVHVDCDLYGPVAYCARELRSRILPTGIIYFDDYGHEHCPGATRAVLQYFPESLLNVVTLPDGTAWSCWIEMSDLANTR